MPVHRTSWWLIVLTVGCDSPPGDVESTRAAAPEPAPPPTADRARPEPERSTTKLDFDRHVKALREKLPSDAFHIVVEPPFVVVGDDSEERVRWWSKRTVGAAVQRLKAMYFERDPDHIIDIWLFRGPDSYRHHTWELFRDRPTTPYGYYSASDRALVMDISTGGGTLIHEIVHPFMDANFPDCPAWFNEGLASLYEQSRFSREGKPLRIRGLTNWRLRGLQDAIAADDVPYFATLCATTTHEFYEEDPGTNYSQARYLCYYLQEHGLLQRFYREFRANSAEDPTGYATLENVLARDDMTEFHREWQAWVAKLVFR